MGCGLIPCPSQDGYKRLPPPSPRYSGSEVRVGTSRLSALDGTGGDSILEGSFRLPPPSPRLNSSCLVADSMIANNGDLQDLLGKHGADSKSGDGASYSAWPAGLEQPESDRQQERIHEINGHGRFLLPQPSLVSLEASTLVDLANLEKDVCRQPLRPLVIYS